MKRADRLLVDLELVDSRTLASELIAGGFVSFRGEKIKKASQALPEEVPAEDFVIASNPWQKYVSRGGLKLEGALDHLRLAVKGWRALDVGLSTGGFTDCLLQRGVHSVIGVDVGRDQTHERLRGEERLTVLEGLHIKDLTREQVGEVDLCVVDVSFISLTRVLPLLSALLAENARILALVKPQFEVGPQGLAKGGLVKEKRLYEGVEKRIRSCAAAHHLVVADYFASPIKGRDGNAEFFIWAKRVGVGGRTDGLSESGGKSEGE